MDAEQLCVLEQLFKLINDSRLCKNDIDKCRLYLEIAQLNWNRSSSSSSNTTNNGTNGSSSSSGCTTPTTKLNRPPSIIYDLDSEECLTKARHLLLKHKYPDEKSCDLVNNMQQMKLNEDNNKENRGGDGTTTLKSTTTS